MEVRALLDLGDVAKATRKLDDLAERVGWRWRLVWFRAVSEMLTADYDSATKHFTEVLDTLPGELAPKLALAATAELARHRRRAHVLQDGVEHRQRRHLRGLRAGPRAVGGRAARRRGAARSTRCPPTSRHFTTARLTSAVTLLSGRSISEITEQQIRDAARRVEALPDTRAAGAADPRAGAGHRDGLAGRQHRQHQPHPRLPVHRARSATRRRGVAARAGPGGADAGAPLCAGRPGQQRAADAARSDSTAETSHTRRPGRWPAPRRWG